MKKNLALVLIFLFAANIAFSQTAESPVPQMDQSVKNLANDVHAKLIEKKAEKIVIGQFTYNDGITSFSTYWINQLIAELTNMPRRNYAVYSGSAAEAEWTLTGEIVQVADVVRIYSRLVRLLDRSIETSFYSSFQRNEHFNEMISQSSSGGGSSSSSSNIRDSREPDSWDFPVTYVIGSSASVPSMNRALTEDDEDFFLLVPERDGRLTVETTGNTDTVMELHNYDDGEEIADNDDGGQNTNAKITVNVRAGVRYLAVVRGYSSSITGAYGFRAYLTVREGASSWDNPISFDIGENENMSAVNRNLQEGDEDFFVLTPERNGRITIETTGRIDSYLELYDAESKEILDENDDIDRNNKNARIRYNVSAGKRYIVKVRGYDSSVRGNYSLRVFFSSQGTQAPDGYETDDEPSQAKEITAGTPQTRTFHSGDDIDWIRFQITAAGMYNISARGEKNNQLDTFIELYDSNLNSIAQDDDSGDSVSSRISINLNAGVYYLKVWCLDEEPDQGYIVNITKP